MEQEVEILRICSLLKGSFAKETYHFKEPTKLTLLIGCNRGAGGLKVSFQIITLLKSTSASITTP